MTIQAVLDGVGAANEMSQIPAEIDEIVPYQRTVSDEWRLILTDADNIHPPRAKPKKKKNASNRQEDEGLWSSNFTYAKLQNLLKLNEDCFIDPVFRNHIYATQAQKKNIFKNGMKRTFDSLE